MIRLGVPVEQFWHRIPGGTGRATYGTLRALADVACDGAGADDAAGAAGGGVEARLLAAWHRPSRRHPAGLGDLGPVRFAPLPRPLLYEGWLRLGRPRIEPWTGPVDVVWAAAMVMAPSRAPVVATVHDLGFLDNPERSSRRGREFFPRAWAAVGERAAMVVCPSQVVADDCVRHGLEPARVRVVPWGVDAARVPEVEAEAVRRRHGLPATFALWVGTLEPRKNLERLVAAIGQVPGLHLAVVGPPGWNLDGRDVLAPLERRVHRLGPVGDAELGALYRAAAVFVFPSLLEGFGLPVLEAMAQGTPVVTSAGTATAEAAGDAAVLIDPLDVDAVAAAVASVLDDAALAADLGERGLRRAAERSWAATAAGYAAVFRQTVTATGAGAD